MKEADISPLTYRDLLSYLGLWLLMSTWYRWKRECFWIVTPFDQESTPCPYRLGEFTSKLHFNAITHELRFTNSKPPNLCWSVLENFPDGKVMEWPHEFHLSCLLCNLAQWAYVHLEYHMDMPSMDLLSSEVPSIWEWVAHCLLWLVLYLVFCWVGRR